MQKVKQGVVRAYSSLLRADARSEDVVMTEGVNHLYVKELGCLLDSFRLIISYLEILK